MTIGELFRYQQFLSKGNFVFIGREYLTNYQVSNFSTFTRLLMLITALGLDGCFILAVFYILMGISQPDFGVIAIALVLSAAAIFIYLIYASIPRIYFLLKSFLKISY